MLQAAASLLPCLPQLILLAAFVKNRYEASVLSVLPAQARKNGRGVPFDRDALQISVCSRKPKSWTSLEDELRGQLQCARVAREHTFRIVERGVAWLQETPAPGVPDGLHVVQRSRHELRMI